MDRHFSNTFFDSFREFDRFERSMFEDPFFVSHKEEPNMIPEK